MIFNCFQIATVRSADVLSADNSGKEEKRESEDNGLSNSICWVVFFLFSLLTDGILMHDEMENNK